MTSEELASNSVLEDMPVESMDESALEDFQTSAMSTAYISAPGMKYAGNYSDYKGRPTILLRWYQGNLDDRGGRFTKFNIYVDGMYYTTLSCSRDYDCQRRFYSDTRLIKPGSRKFSVVGIDSAGKFTPRSSDRVLVVE